MSVDLWTCHRISNPKSDGAKESERPPVTGGFIDYRSDPIDRTALGAYTEIAAAHHTFGSSKWVPKCFEAQITIQQKYLSLLSVTTPVIAGKL